MKTTKKEDQTPPAYLTRTEATTFTGLSLSTIKRLARQGRLKKYRRPGMKEILYSREELDAVLVPRPVSA